MTKDQYSCCADDASGDGSSSEHSESLVDSDRDEASDAPSPKRRGSAARARSAPGAKPDALGAH